MQNATIVSTQMAADTIHSSLFCGPVLVPTRPCLGLLRNDGNLTRYQTRTAQIESRKPFFSDHLNKQFDGYVLCTLLVKYI